MKTNVHTDLRLGSLIDTARMVFSLKNLPKKLSGPSVKKIGKATYVVSKHGGQANIYMWRKKNKVSIEASIPKYFTGQNLFGIEHLHYGCFHLVCDVLSRAGIAFPDKDKERLKSGGYRVTRIDYAAHVACNSEVDANSLMESVAGVALRLANDYTAYRRQGRVETVMIGKHSKRRMGRVYRKDLEMRHRKKRDGHRPPKSLLRAASFVVRIEEVMKGRELQRLGLDNPLNWKPEIGRGWIAKRVSEFCAGSDTFLDLSSTGLKIGSKISDRFSAFVHGDIGAFTRHPKSLGRHRSEVLRKTGIDVRIPLPADRQLEFKRTLRQLLQDRVQLGGIDQTQWTEMCDGLPPGPARPTL